MPRTVDAQREYAEVDRDRNGVIEYAQKLMSTPGKRDGLFWPTQAGEAPSPFGPLAAQARAAGYGKSKDGGAQSSRRQTGGNAFHGYRFKVLNSQGKEARGDAYDYIVNGKMIGGFALVAYPARYGASGVMTFMCNHDGIVFEKDLGPRSGEIAQAMAAFNPDRIWTKADQQ